MNESSLSFFFFFIFRCDQKRVCNHQSGNSILFKLALQKNLACGGLGFAFFIHELGISFYFRFSFFIHKLDISEFTNSLGKNSLADGRQKINCGPPNEWTTPQNTNPRRLGSQNARSKIGNDLSSLTTFLTNQFHDSNIIGTLKTYLCCRSIPENRMIRTKKYSDLWFHVFAVRLSWIRV